MSIGNEPEVTPSRSPLVLLVGAVCGVIAVFFLALAAFLAVTGSAMTQPLMFGVMSLFPLAISIALLVRRYREPALRTVAGISCLILGATLVLSFFSPNVEIGSGTTLYGGMCGALGVWAVTGRLPR